jgi:hypothetical protein
VDDEDDEEDEADDEADEADEEEEEADAEDAEFPFATISSDRSTIWRRCFKDIRVVWRARATLKSGLARIPWTITTNRAYHL